MPLRRLVPLAVPLAAGLVRDRGEAEGLVHARAEADLFALLLERRAAAAEELRAVELTARSLADLQARPGAVISEVRQTFSSSLPLVSRYRTVLQHQVALLGGSLRESVARLRALAADLQQSAQVQSPSIISYISSCPPERDAHDFCRARPA